MARYIRGKRKTDALEYLIRFVCGAAFGLASCFFVLRMWYDPDSPLVLIGMAVLCGLLAAWKGDEFYTGS